MEEKNLAIAVVGDFKYLRKYFYNFYQNLLKNGNYKGEVVVITSKITPTLFIKSIRKNNRVKVVRFSNIKFNKDTSKRYKNLNTKGQPNRFKSKYFQWFKVNLFDMSMKNWNYILYLDINLTIHFDINPLLKTLPKGKFFAKADGYPDYTRKLISQFDTSQPEIVELKKEYDLEDSKYFQTGLMFYSTEFINQNTKQEIINIANAYPISLTNEQGILNLYFQTKKDLYEELPEYVEDYLLYYYWIVKDQKIIITKQLVEQYK